MKTTITKTTVNSDRRLASVSLDLDNLWSYLKIHGDPDWRTRPSYLQTLVPHALDTLDALGLRITFFIVGADAEDARNTAVLREIVRRGHEVGNHSFEHEPWMHRNTPEQLDAEIERADRAITAATGARPVGFRGPGFSWCPELLQVLERRGYLFDASTFPTYLGPLARLYYFWTSKLSREQQSDRDELFGKFSEGLRPVKPYLWDLQAGTRLLEIPVTTMPLFKVPFHLSYLLFLSRYSVGLALLYFRFALLLCRLTGTQPSLLLHPLDLMGGDQIPQLAFFPGMDLPSKTKTDFVCRVLRLLGEHYQIVPMSVHARSLLGKGRLELRRPASAAAQA